MMRLKIVNIPTRGGPGDLYFDLYLTNDKKIRITLVDLSEESFKRLEGVF
ncbi:MAG: hypothetical protein AB1779_07105 [Candidatus Thermoplasmatota archaeon]